MKKEMVIEKGVPVPSRYSRGSDGKYPFGKMEVGDCLFVPCEKSDSGRIVGRIYAAVNNYRKTQNPNFAYTVRSIIGGVRMWRLPDKRQTA